VTRRRKQVPDPPPLGAPLGSRWADQVVLARWHGQELVRDPPAFSLARLDGVITQPLPPSHRRQPLYLPAEAVRQQIVDAINRLVAEERERRSRSLPLPKRQEHIYLLRLAAVFIAAAMTDARNRSPSIGPGGQLVRFLVATMRYITGRDLHRKTVSEWLRLEKGSKRWQAAEADAKRTLRLPNA
jgi:hypothetical protein